MTKNSMPAMGAVWWTLIASVGWAAACTSSTPSKGSDAKATGGGGIDDAASTADMSKPPDAGTDGPGLVDGLVAASPASIELDWLLGVLNGPPAGITKESVEAHFSPAFLRQLPADSLVSTLAELATAFAPVALRQIESSTSESPSSPASTVVAITETGGHLFLRFALQASTRSSGQIDGLLISMAPEYDVALRDPAVLDARLAQVAPDARLLIGRIEGAACVPVHGLREDQSMPLGSLFKIYVLGALAADVESGRTQWADLVTIEERWKSLPSGVLQDQPDGTMVSVEDVASKMISISDNTAADHLLRLVGRERVEAHQVDMGHSNPALNVPFLSTRELFQLKISATAEERAAFLAAGPDERRLLLEGDYDQRPLPDLAAEMAFAAPVAIDQLEWFASPADICRAFAALKQATAQPSGDVVSTILSLNPGLPIDSRTFSYVGFKGGSEPGVLAFAWLLHRISDGQWMVVTLGFADRNNPLDEDLGAYYALAAVQMAGR